MKHSIRDYTFYFVSIIPDLKIFLANASCNWSNSDKYRYIETKSDNGSVYALTLDQADATFQKCEFKHFILGNEYNADPAVLKELNSNGMEISGTGDIWNNYRRTWFILPKNDNVSIVQNGFNRNNILYI